MKPLKNIYRVCRQVAMNFLAITVLMAESGLYLQAQHYSVQSAPFSSRGTDEFSPVFYRGGVVFCSNRRDNSMVGFADEQDRTLSLFYARKGSSGWKAPKILSGEITTSFHDGPATFDKACNIMYFSRNNQIENTWRNIRDTSNKLGIYSAEFIDGSWQNVRPFSYNDPAFAYTTPALSPDGQRLYFASDMPGGHGGMDLYYCDRGSSDWCEPVNMGPLINTSGNESFPFADAYGKVYFASDGHSGYGGKDLFLTLQEGSSWISPVHLDSAINSPSDDFGLVMDSNSQGGFFSTNRLKSDDIFSFTAKPVAFNSCPDVKENNFCFTFFDERYALIDTLPVIYRWDFGNGIIRSGFEVKHCFPGPGDYMVRLDIIDQYTGEAIVTQVEYPVKLAPVEQGNINAINVGISGEPVLFDATQSDLPGLQLTGYLWDFGDGFKPGRPMIQKMFEKKGVYTVRLGLIGHEPESGKIRTSCVSKKVRIVEAIQGVPNAILYFF